MAPGAYDMVFRDVAVRPFLKGFKPLREEFHWLFNSYYNSLGQEIPEKSLRSVFSRPSLVEILAFRVHAACFRHPALWNSIESRIEMHLESTRKQHVSIDHADLELHFMPRETIHTENSYKFTDQGIRSLLEQVGFEIKGAWKDDRGWYTLTLGCLR